MKSLQTIAFAAKMTAVSSALKAEGKTLGFVPTMGALHQGHLSLIDRARKECDVVVASIFVNPMQFNDSSDFERYPRTPDADVELLTLRGCDYIFLPDSLDEVFPPGYIPFDAELGGLALVMEGAHRPGHFKGVVNVVERLFTIVQPDRAYFGLKDYQQYSIIRKLVELHNLPVEVIGVATSRSETGLALSSRNQLLTASQKEQAAFLHDALQLARKLYPSTPLSAVKQEVHQFFSRHPEFELEYFELADGHTLQPLTDDGAAELPMAFVAARLGQIRLIDNIYLKD